MLDTNKMDRLTKGLETKSEKMRVLAKAGFARADIARYLDVKYQFVRNVLVREEDKQVPDGVASARGPDVPNRTTLDADGFVRIPQRAIAALGLKPGETLTVTVDDGEIRLMTIATATRKVQALVRQYVPEGISLVDELLAERRLEAARENGE
ncbi:MAG: hypothetical protein PSV22_07160 [Pseudolabrys sp.]|jgi:antitoxin component of MazEF toxin-antitoxin module|nr:hypothetical protein [Pseudolabrys sp.]